MVHDDAEAELDPYDCLANLTLSGDGRLQSDRNGDINFDTACLSTCFTAASQEGNDRSMKSSEQQQQRKILDGLLLDCQLVDSFLKQRTYWYSPKVSQPRCFLEQLAHQVLGQHLGSLETNAVMGAEWWVQLRPSPVKSGRFAIAKNDEDNDEDDKEAPPDISFHWDKDEDLRLLLGGDTYIFPQLSTVTYLTDPTIIPSPTVVIENGRIQTSGQYQLDPVSSSSSNEDPCCSAVVSWPKQGKHLKFDGRFLHGAPKELVDRHATVAARKLQETTAAAAAAACATSSTITTTATDDLLERRSRRVTFLVNLWIGHKPYNVHPIPQDMIKHLQKPLPDFQLFPKASSVEESMLQLHVNNNNYNEKSNNKKQKMTIVLGQCHAHSPVTSQTMAWSLGSSSSSDRLILEDVPLTEVRQLQPYGKTACITWKYKDGIRLVHAVTGDKSQGTDNNSTANTITDSENGCTPMQGINGGDYANRIEHAAQTLAELGTPLKETTTTTTTTSARAIHFDVSQHFEQGDEPTNGEEGNAAGSQTFDTAATSDAVVFHDDVSPMPMMMTTTTIPFNRTQLLAAKTTTTSKPNKPRIHISTSRLRFRLANLAKKKEEGSEDDDGKPDRNSNIAESLISESSIGATKVHHDCRPTSWERVQAQFPREEVKSLIETIAAQYNETNRIGDDLDWKMITRMMRRRGFKGDQHRKAYFANMYKNHIKGKILILHENSQDAQNFLSDVCGSIRTLIQTKILEEVNKHVPLSTRAALVSHTQSLYYRIMEDSGIDALFWKSTDKKGLEDDFETFDSELRVVADECHEKLKKNQPEYFQEHSYSSRKRPRGEDDSDLPSSSVPSVTRSSDISPGDVEESDVDYEDDEDEDFEGSDDDEAGNAPSTSSPVHDLLQAPPPLLYRASIMETKNADEPQLPHIDYQWDKSRLHKIGFSAVTEDGMYIQIWKNELLLRRRREREKLQAKVSLTASGNVSPRPAVQSSNDGHSVTSPSSVVHHSPIVEGQIVFIPFGQLICLPGDTIHAGGFLTNHKTGNKRMHFYIFKDQMETSLINLYQREEEPYENLSILNKHSRWCGQERKVAACPFLWK